MIPRQNWRPSIRYAAEESGVEPLPDADSANYLFEFAGSDCCKLHPNESPALHEDIRQRYVGHYIGMDQTPTPLFRIRRNQNTAYAARCGLHLAVATGKARRFDRRINGWHAKFFHATRCADETRSKPHPQNAAARELLDFLCEPGRILMVRRFFMTWKWRRLQVCRCVSGAHRDKCALYEPVVCLDRFVDLPPAVTSIVDLGRSHRRQQKG